MRTNVGDYGIYPQKTIGGLLLVIDTRDLASFWDFVFWLEIVSTSQRVSPQYPRHIVVVGYYSQNRPSVASWLTFVRAHKTKNLKLLQRLMHSIFRIWRD
jgi:hypothetical protein